MKLALGLMGIALLQGAATDGGPVAEPQHLRYERAVNVPANTNGPTCAVLDAGVYAHAASRAVNDLRLYAGGVETPFALTENSAAPVEMERLTPQNLGVQDGRVVFDLPMPARAYSEVDLELNLRDFIAVAEVTAPENNAPPVKLGEFTLFDLTSQHGARSTALPLQESNFPRLHVALRLSTPDGKPMPVSTQPLVTGATVPPSRVAQTLFVAAAETKDVRREGRFTVARFNVPAHVPIERATVVLDPEFHANFVRNVTVADVTRRDGSANEVADESVPGEISREVLNVPGAPAIHAEKLSVDAELAVNLREPATIEVRIDNGNDPPLPVREVRLEMRERRICFAAQADASYTLRYGDEALHAPVYDFARLFNASASAAQATLGPERVNPQFAPRADARPFTERHPELLWIALVAVVVLLGATAIGSVKHQKRSQE